jgi:hypothetical protein
MSRFSLAATALVAAAMLAGTLAQVPAQQQGQAPPPPAPPKPYKVVAITLPKPNPDPSYAAFIKQLTGIAQKKDKAALGRLIAANFFWIPEDKDVADKKKSGIDNLAKALGLDNRQLNGWELLTSFMADLTTEPFPDRKGVVCGPAGPTFDEKAAEEIAAATQTDQSDWGYPMRDGVSVRSAAPANSPATEKLGLHLVRVYLDESLDASPDTLRIVTPSGKIGFVKAEEVVPLSNDQLCYIKEGNAWKISGVLGGAQQ